MGVRPDPVPKREAYLSVHESGTSENGSSQDLHSPKQVARAFGVSEATMKRWCDRGLLTVNRTAGGHRRIPSQAVLAFLKSAKQTLVYPELLGLPPNTGRKTSKMETAVPDLPNRLIQGEVDTARGMVLDLYLSGVPLHDIFDKVLAPAFREIGCGWESGDVQIYQERWSCNVCMYLLLQISELLDKPRSGGPKAIGGTLSLDHYQIPVLMGALVLRTHGWNAEVLGTNLPGATLATAVRQKQPSLVWLSVSHIADDSQFLEEYGQLKAACDKTGAWLVIGGRALTPDRRTRLGYTAYCDTMAHFASFLTSTGTERPS